MAEHPARRMLGERPLPSDPTTAVVTPLPPGSGCGTSGKADAVGWPKNCFPDRRLSPVGAPVGNEASCVPVSRAAGFGSRSRRALSCRSGWNRQWSRHRRDLGAQLPRERPCMNRELILRHPGKGGGGLFLHGGRRKLLHLTRTRSFGPFGKHRLGGRSFAPCLQLKLGRTLLSPHRQAVIFCSSYSAITWGCFPK